MEFLIGFVVLIVVVAFLITALSPRDTKLFRRIWSAERAGVIDAKHEAINELHARFNVSIPQSAEGADIDKLGDSIGRLMAKSTEFDLKYKNNLGVVVSNILASNLEIKLHAAGIKEFDEQLQMVQGVDIAQLAQAMGKATQPENIAMIDNEIHNETAVNPDLLRKEARKSYDNGWMKAKSAGKNEKQCHETALVCVLFDRFEKVFGGTKQTEEIVKAHMMETLPFNIIDVEQGREAIVEYVVWREQEEKANKKLIYSAVTEAKREILKSDGGKEFLNSLTNEKIGWTRFLTNS